MIEPSTPGFSSPSLTIKNKKEDFRAINTQTMTDNAQLSYIEYILYEFKVSKFRQW